MATSETKVTLQEYRDLIDEVRDLLDSCKSAATDAEAEKECRRLLPIAEQLESADCLAAKTLDALRCSRVLTEAREHVCTTLLRIYDNQTIEAEYR